MSQTVPEIEGPFDTIGSDPAWGAKGGVGSFFTVEFGPPSSSEDGHGRCHLWIASTSWRLIVDGSWYSSHDPKDVIAQAVRRLDGRTLVRARVAELGDLHLEFSGQAVLTTFSDVRDDGADPWLLFTPGKVYVGVAAIGRYWDIEVVDADHGPHRLDD